MNKGMARLQPVRNVVKRSRFGIYGAVTAALLATISAAHSMAVVLSAGALLCLTLAIGGIDLQRSFLDRLGAILGSNKAISESVVQLRTTSLSLMRRFESAKTDLQELRIGVSQTRAASESQASNHAFRSLDGRPRVLFVTSNGSGMGHLTRLTAIARAGRDVFDSVFVSLSSAAEVAAIQGFDVLRLASQQASGLTWPEWNRRFSESFGRVLDEVRPNAVVFDGIRVFRGVHERASNCGIPVAWVCRGLWKDGIDASQVEHWRDVAELLILPSEGRLMSAEESSPPGARGGLVVNPIVHPSAEKRLTRSQSLEELRLAPQQRHILLQLGSGGLMDPRPFEEAAVAAVRLLGSDWNLVHLRSPLAKRDLGAVDGTQVLNRYPIASHLAAFEFSITAAGYNTVHEHIMLAQPSIYVPNPHMLADDQPQRARSVLKRGAGLLVEEPDAMRAAVTALANGDRRHAVRSALIDLQTSSGADEAAGAIAELAQGPNHALAPFWFHAQEEN